MSSHFMKLSCWSLIYVIYVYAVDALYFFCPVFVHLTMFDHTVLFSSHIYLFRSSLQRVGY